MSRYPEANWMHKRMLGASQRLARCPRQSAVPPCRNTCTARRPTTPTGTDCSVRALPAHLRARRLEQPAGARSGAFRRVAQRRLLSGSISDHDGCLELALRNSNLQAFVRDDHHAALVEFSSLALAHNFGDTLRGLCRGLPRQDRHGAGAQAAQEAWRRHSLGP